MGIGVSVCWYYCLHIFRYFPSLLSPISQNKDGRLQRFNILKLLKLLEVANLMFVRVEREKKVLLMGTMFSCKTEIVF